MIFTDIRLQNYRSYKDESFEVGSSVNIVVGPNAVGKTNLLEAFMLSSVGKSFRARDKYLINHDSDWSRIDTHTSDNRTRVVKLKKLSQDKVEKIFEIDEKPLKKLPAQYLQPVVIFQPDDLLLLKSEPTTRRNYLDNLLEQIDATYEKTLGHYSRVISQRNSLLKSPNFSNEQLFVWDLRLCELATVIVQKRIDLIEKLNSNLSDSYSSICGKKTELNINYVSKTDTKNYSNQLMKQLKENLQLDKIRGYTSRGPHRDDIEVCFGDIPLSISASRGENRTFVLALKTIELKLLESSTGTKPLLLLDDVFSELDGSRRNALTKYLNEYQTIITTTDADVIAKNFTKSANVILL